SRTQPRILKPQILPQTVITKQRRQLILLRTRRSSWKPRRARNSVRQPSRLLTGRALTKVSARARAPRRTLDQAAMPVTTRQRVITRQSAALTQVAAVAFIMTIAIDRAAEPSGKNIAIN